MTARCLQNCEIFTVKLIILGQEYHMVDSICTDFYQINTEISAMKSLVETALSLCSFDSLALLGILAGNHGARLPQNLQTHTKFL